MLVYVSSIYLIKYKLYFSLISWSRYNQRVWLIFFSNSRSTTKVHFSYGIKIPKSLKNILFNKVVTPNPFLENAFIRINPSKKLDLAGSSSFWRPCKIHVLKFIQSSTQIFDACFWICVFMIDSLCLLVIVVWMLFFISSCLLNNLIIIV